MRTSRFSIAGLMGAVLVAAVGLAALRSASPIWAGAMLLLTYVVLGLAILCAVLRGRARRAWWLGFCVFGWGYLGLRGESGPGVDSIKLPTTAMLEALGPWLGVPVLHSTGLDTTDRLEPVVRADRPRPRHAPGGRRRRHPGPSPLRRAGGSLRERCEPARARPARRPGRGGPG